MRRCLELAQKGTGRVSPNPRVGAVMVAGGEIISEGYHRFFGGPHAEVEALERLPRERLRSATLYLNLEPCCFRGKTPPCTELILGKGILRVVVGMKDPNPRVNGGGIEDLRRNGVEVKVGVLEKRCRELNSGYIKHITTGLPEVILKMANSIDGRIGTITKDSRWITGETARAYAHQMRAEVDAVLVGVGTVLADDPMLTVRHVEGVHPLRVILDSNLRTPLNSKVLTDQNQIPTVLFTSDETPRDRIALYEELGVKVVGVSLNPGEGLSIDEILKHLGDSGVTSIMVEGGAEVFTSFLKKHLADRLIVVLAPKFIGADGVPVVGELGISDMSQVKECKFRRVKRLGEDVMLEIVFNGC